MGRPVAATGGIPEAILRRRERHRFTARALRQGTTTAWADAFDKAKYEVYIGPEYDKFTEGDLNAMCKLYANNTVTPKPPCARSEAKQQEHMRKLRASEYAHTLPKSIPWHERFREGMANETPVTDAEFDQLKKTRDKRKIKPLW